MPATTSSVIALDVGNKRIGIAIASLEARLPSPLKTLPWDNNFFMELGRLIDQNEVTSIVVGLPRNLQGDSTSQTSSTEDFVKQLKSVTSLPVDLQDEALTSSKAEAELQSRGKPYQKSDIDALAATYILEDWFTQRERESKLSDD